MASLRWLGIGAVIVAAMLWGTTGTVQAFLPDGRDPLAVGALRLSFGALSLLALVLIQSDWRRIRPGLPWAGILFAGAAIGAYNLLFFWAVSLAGVGVGTAITIGSAPIWATAYETMTTRQWPTPLRLLGQAVSISGVALLGLTGGGAQGMLAGVGLALGAGLSYAAYSLATSRIGHRAPSTVIAAGTFSVAALLTLPVLFMVPLTWIEGGATWMTLAFLGIGATGVAYAFYTWGLTRVAASTAVTLALAEPVTAWLLATFLVGEAVTAISVLGVLLILGGLVVVTLTPAQART